MTLRILHHRGRLVRKGEWQTGHEEHHVLSGSGQPLIGQLLQVAERRATAASTVL